MSSLLLFEEQWLDGLNNTIVFSQTALTIYTVVMYVELSILESYKKTKGESDTLVVMVKPHLIPSLVIEYKEDRKNLDMNKAKGMYMVRMYLDHLFSSPFVEFVCSRLVHTK
jgi:hypothetical protein